MEKQSLNRGKYVTSMFGALILSGLHFVSLYNYLLFHCLVEMFSIAVAWGIFMIVRNTHRFTDNTYLYFLGIAYLFTGGMDLLYTLAYKGMGIFHENEGNLSIQLWVFARYMESVSLFIAPFFLSRKMNMGFVFSCYVGVSALLLLSVFQWGIYPNCFVDGEGLTAFKKMNEYVICLILVGAILMLFRKRGEFDTLVFRWLVASVALAIVSELSFTLYASPYGLSNLIGHYFKIVSFYLIYKAIIKTGLVEPYRLLFRNLRQKTNALKESESRFDAFMKNNPAIAFIKDEQGRMLYINPAFEAAFEFQETDWKGKDDFELWSTSTAEQLRKNDLCVLRSGQPGAREETILHKDSEHHWMTFRFPFQDASGQRFVGGTGLDLTDRKKMQEEILQAKTRAEEANRAKSEFLANMSHEIRTPISGIIGMADMTLSMDMGDQEREHLEMIKDSAISLLNIINDILDFSKIEAKKMELSMEDFDFHKMMEQITSTFALLAKEAGLDINLIVMREVPRYLYGDAGRLTQVIRNLVSNAVKFTQKGTIALKIDKIQETQERITLLISVSDTGSGIPENKMPQLFQSFSQLDSSCSKRYGGTGLGLAISKELVEMMGGTIWAESREGKGSTFHFTVQFKPTKKDVAAENHRKKEKTRDMPMSLRILLAEDNKVNQKFISHFLTENGHDVLAVANGKEALAALDKEPFDLILMDVQMPKMNGIETTRTIRNLASENQNQNYHIPIIALTAYAMKGDRERFLEAGMDDYVSKPVDMAELLVAMTRVVTGKPGKADAKPRLRENACVSSITNFMECYQEKEEVLKEIFQIFMSESCSMMNELDKALLSGDLERAVMAAHSVVNSAGGIGAHFAADSARKLEHAARDGNLGKARCQHEKLKQEMGLVLKFVKKCYPPIWNQQKTKKAIVPPPNEEIDVLFTLAMRGDVLRIQERARAIKALGPEFIPFGEEIYRLARNLMIEELQDFVEQYM